MEPPLHKVVFIQKIASFAPLSLDGIIKLAYVNNSWADTIKNYGAHIVAERARAGNDSTCTSVFTRAFECDMLWLLNALLYTRSFVERINLPWTVCVNSTPLETAKFVLDKMVEVGGNEILNKQLAETRHYRHNASNEPSTYTDGWTCLMVACANSSPPEVVKLVCEKINEAGGKELLKSQLTATTNIFGWTCLMLACSNSSPEVVKLVCEKINEAGGPALLKSQLTATAKDYTNCLMHCCRNSSSPDVIKLVFDKIVKVSDMNLLKRQFGRGHTTCLTHACQYSSFPEIVKLVFEMIDEAGGIPLLRSQISAIDYDGETCLMKIHSRRPPSPELMTLIFQKIVEAGGPALFKSQLAQNRLLQTCVSSSSPEAVKLVFAKIIEIGGRDLLMNELTATDHSTGKNYLMMSCDSPFPEVMKLVIEKIVEAGGRDLLRSQLTANIGDYGWTCLESACYQKPEVLRPLTTLLFHLDLFQQQYMKLGSDDKKTLKESAGIGSSSWRPDSASVAGVQEMLRTHDPAAIKKAEEEADLAKKKKVEGDKFPSLSSLM